MKPAPQSSPARSVHARMLAPGRSKWLSFVLAVLLSPALISSPAAASELYNFTASVFGTVGGALDVAGEDPGLGQTGFQLGFSWLTQPKTEVGVRLGQVSMNGEQIEGLFDPELQYVTIGGEYKYQEAYYRSGLYLGLGLYSIDGIAGGLPTDDSSIGLTLGVTGEFPINSRFSIVGEVSAHYADLLYAQFFGFGHLGVAFHF